MNAATEPDAAICLRVGIADDQGKVYQVIELHGLVQAIGAFERLHRQGLHGASPEAPQAREALTRVFRPA